MKLHGEFILGCLWMAAWLYAIQHGWHRHLLCRVGWHGPQELHTLAVRDNEHSTTFPYSVAEMARCPRCGRMKVLFWYDWHERAPHNGSTPPAVAPLSPEGEVR